MHGSHRRTSGKSLAAGSLLAIVLAATGAACGSVPASSTSAGGPPPAVQAAIDSSTASPLGASVLSFTLDEAAEVGSASFEATAELSVDGSDEPLSLALNGTYDLPDQSSQVEIDLSGLSSLGALAASEFGDGDADGLGGDGFGLGDGGLATLFSEPMEIIAADQTVYVRGGLANLLSSGQWLRFDAGTAGLFEAPLGATYTGRGPVDLLEDLEDVEAQITDLGREEVRGVDTQHLQATIDLTTLNLSTGPDAERWITQLDDIGLTELPIELWLDDDGLVRRLEVAVDVADPAPSDDGRDEDGPGSLLGNGAASARLQIEVFDYGVDPEITAPAEAETIDLDELFGS